MEGFTHDALAITEPSVTNRFGTSCAWQNPLTAEVFGSRPMRAVPISWMPRPAPACGGALIPVAAHEVVPLRRRVAQVAEARDVDPVRPVPLIVVVGQPFD